MASAGKVGPGYRNTGLTIVRVTVRERERDALAIIMHHKCTRVIILN